MMRTEYMTLNLQRSIGRYGRAGNHGAKWVLA
jgi:hypothetical protein